MGSKRAGTADGTIGANTGSLSDALASLACFPSSILLSLLDTDGVVRASERTCSIRCSVGCSIRCLPINLDRGGRSTLIGAPLSHLIGVASDLIGVLRRG